mgnify:CR=1 FL=1
MLVWPKLCITSLTNHTDLFLYTYFIKKAEEMLQEKRKEREKARRIRMQEMEKKLREVREWLMLCLCFSVDWSPRTFSDYVLM